MCMEAGVYETISYVDPPQNVHTTWDLAPLETIVPGTSRVAGNHKGFSF